MKRRNINTLAVELAWAHAVAGDARERGSHEEMQGALQIANAVADQIRAQVPGQQLGDVLDAVFRKSGMPPVPLALTPHSRKMPN